MFNEKICVKSYAKGLKPTESSVMLTIIVIIIIIIIIVIFELACLPLKRSCD